jgi:hypothetical protein
LGVVDLAGAEQGVEGVVAGDDEPSNIDEELASNVEKDEEEVEADEAEDGVDLGDGGLLLEVVEGGVFGQLHHSTVSTTVHQDINIQSTTPTMLENRNGPDRNSNVSQVVLTSLSSCDSDCWARSWTDMAARLWRVECGYVEAKDDAEG